LIHDIFPPECVLASILADSKPPALTDWQRQQVRQALQRIWDDLRSDQKEALEAVGALVSIFGLE
jgi:hypothetical protein